MMRRITRAKAVERLTKYWESDVDKYPLMRKYIPLELYLKRNVGHVARNGLLARFDNDHKPWCRYMFECHEV